MPPKKKGKWKGPKGPKDTKKNGVMLFAEELEDYAKVTKSLGDRRVSVILPDKTEILAIIPGRFRKRIWVSVGDILLVSKREFQDGKVDILHKYDVADIHKLHKTGLLPDFFIDMEVGNDDGGNMLFVNDTGDIEENAVEEPKEFDSESDESSNEESEVDIDNL